MRTVEHTVNSLDEPVVVYRVGGNLVCPVCGFVWLRTETFKSLNILNGLEVCQCCKLQLGYHDIEHIPPDPARPPEVRWRGLRNQWLERVAWCDSALEQLRDNLGMDTETVRRDAGRSD
jgi:hypothetical protein